MTEVFWKITLGLFLLPGSLAVLLFILRPMFSWLLHVLRRKI